MALGQGTRLGTWGIALLSRLLVGRVEALEWPTAPGLAGSRRSAILAEVEAQTAQ